MPKEFLFPNSHLGRLNSSKPIKPKEYLDQRQRDKGVVVCLHHYIIFLGDDHFDDKEMSKSCPECQKELLEKL